MANSWQSLRISGAWRRKVRFQPDDRGSFAELWRASWVSDLPSAGGGMGQANLSRSRQGVLRGLHVHRRQADLWVVVEGHPYVALVDIRPVLERDGAPVRETVDAAPGDALYLPEGVAHGFYARDPITLVYFVTKEYDGTDEFGFAWDDRAAGVDWPTAEPILSARDRDNPTLGELVEQIRQQTSVR